MYRTENIRYSPLFEDANSDAIDDNLFTFSYPNDTVYKYYYDDREKSETKDMWWAFNFKRTKKKTCLDIETDSKFEISIEKLNKEFSKSAKLKKTDPSPSGTATEEEKKSDDKTKEKEEKEPSTLFPDESPEMVNKKIIDLIKEKKIKLVRSGEDYGQVRKLFVTYKGKAPKESTQDIMKDYMSKSGMVDNPKIKDQIRQQQAQNKEEIVIRFVKKDDASYDQAPENNSLGTFLCFYYAGELKDKRWSKKWKFKGKEISDTEKDRLQDIVNALAWKEKLKMGDKKEVVQDSYLYRDFNKFKMFE